MKIFIAAFLLFCSYNTLAASIDGVKISKVAINPTYGNYVFIKLDSAPDRISCSTNGAWDYTLSLETEIHKSMYALLLAAFMASKEVNMSGANTCSEFPHIESLKSFDVTQ